MSLSLIAGVLIVLVVAGRILYAINAWRVTSGRRSRLADLGVDSSLDDSPGQFVARLPLARGAEFAWTFRKGITDGLVRFPHDFVMTIPGTDRVPEPLRRAGFEVAHELREVDVVFECSKTEITASGPVHWFTSHPEYAHSHMRTLAEATLKSLPPGRSGV